MIGLLLSLGGLGAVLGALLATRVVAWLGHGRAIWLSLALTMPSAFLLPWADADWRLILVGVQQVVFWAGVLVNSIAQVSLRQLVTPEHMMGRMNATMRFLVWGMTPIGALLGGALGSWFGVRAALWVFAVGASLAFVWVAASPLATLREVPADAAVSRS